jgi:hypothetical protein
VLEIDTVRSLLKGLKPASPDVLVGLSNRGTSVLGKGNRRTASTEEVRSRRREGEYISGARARRQRWKVRISHVISHRTHQVQARRKWHIGVHARSHEQLGSRMKVDENADVG